MEENSSCSTKSYININNKYDRVVVLIDMDCFYCQVEEKLNPSLKGKPLAVVQYNAWKGGGIIAVNYSARAQGVTRHMRGDEAKEQCPDIYLARVPCLREKADLTKYRNAGKEVALVLQKFSTILERASVDEAYIDITEEVNKKLNTMDQGTFQIKPKELLNTYAVGYDNIGKYVQDLTSRIQYENDDFEFEGNSDRETIQRSDLKLLIGSSIANEIRSKVKEVTGYECSAGIAHNKILAKLACGINKPNKQTILPIRQIEILFSTLPVGKITGLGGKFGEDVCEKLNIKFIGDIKRFSENELQKHFDEKNGTWLYLISRGIHLETVTPRFYSKSIGCCKKFPGRNAITGLATLNHWLKELSNEICDRMEKDIIENNRRAKQMVVSFIQEINTDDISSSRSTNLLSFGPEEMMKSSLDILRRNTEQFLKSNSDSILNNPIKFLGISVGKFETIVETNRIAEMFENHKKKVQIEKKTIENHIDDRKNLKSCFFANHIKNSIESSLKIRLDTNNVEANESNSFFLMNTLKRRKSEDDQEITTETITAGSIIETFTDNLNSKNSEPNQSFQEQIQNSKYDYRKTYAECLTPPNPKDEDFISCEKCKKMILIYNMESHMDFHFAFELSQKQREEFRNECKTKLISQSNKKQKIIHSSPINNRIKKRTDGEGNLMEKFLLKNSEIDQTNKLNGNQSKCSECNLWVSTDTMNEHMDFHVAKKLQNEINRPIINSNLKKTQNSTSKTKSVKGIHEFFTTQI